MANAQGKLVSRQSVKQGVGKLVKPLWRPQRGNYAGFFDNTYYLPTKSELNLIIDNIAYPNYASDEFDCEDFTYMCKAETARRVRLNPNFNEPWAIGLAFARFRWMSGGSVDHACNWVVTNDGKLFWIEPQTGKKYPRMHCKNLELLLV